MAERGSSGTRREEERFFLRVLSGLTRSGLGGGLVRVPQPPTVALSVLPNPIADGEPAAEEFLPQGIPALDRLPGGGKLDHRSLATNQRLHLLSYLTGHRIGRSKLIKGQVRLAQRIEQCRWTSICLLSSDPAKSAGHRFVRLLDRSKEAL